MGYHDLVTIWRRGFSHHMANASLASWVGTVVHRARNLRFLRVRFVVLLLINRSRLTEAGHFCGWSSFAGWL